MNDLFNLIKNKTPKSKILNYEKQTINLYHVFDNDGIEYGCINNYVKELGVYEVSLFISNKEDSVGNIKLYETKKKIASKLKFFLYKKITKKKNLKIIEILIK